MCGCVGVRECAKTCLNASIYVYAFVHVCAGIYEGHTCTCTHTCTSINAHAHPRQHIVRSRENDTHLFTTLKMVNEMQIESLNGGEILVNCKFKLNQHLHLNLYREIQLHQRIRTIASTHCVVNTWTHMYIVHSTCVLECSHVPSVNFRYGVATVSRID